MLLPCFKTTQISVTYRLKSNFLAYETLQDLAYVYQFHLILIHSFEMSAHIINFASEEDSKLDEVIWFAPRS